MKCAFGLLAITVFAAGCAGDAAPAKTSDDVATPAAEPAAADKPTAERPASQGSDEGVWAGETEAKNPQVAEGGGKTETRTMEVIGQIVKDNRKPVRE